MSDDDFMMDDGDEDYGFNYEDASDGDADLADADVENLYYTAKSKRDDDPDAARTDFLRVVELEGEEKAEWGFKALKQLAKMSFRGGKYKDAVGHYKQLLTYTKSAVTRNYGEKSINNILDYVSAALGTEGEVLEDFYATTLATLQEHKNDRLWIKTNLKLAKLWLDRREYPKLTKIIRRLRNAIDSAHPASPSTDPARTAHLTDICALEIQMYTDTADMPRLKAVYHESLAIRASTAIAHPRTLGIIRECGGKMHMREQDWVNAQSDFFEAFKCYDEAGSTQRIQVLKYLVLASMLSASQVDPFSAQETRAYASDPQIQAMTNLVAAFQGRRIDEFLRILRNNRTAIMDDPFIRDYIDDVLKSIRQQVLLELIPSYTRVQLAYLASYLNVTDSQVEGLIAELIVDDKINGRIDQVQQILVLDEKSDDKERYQALNRWADAVPGLISCSMRPLSMY